MGPSANAATAIKLVADDDGLDAFGSEADPGEPPSHERLSVDEPAETSGSGSAFVKPFMWGFTLVLIAGLAAAAAWQYQRRVNAAVPGSLAIQTTPAGLEVLIGGVSAGRTPLTASLPPGSHVVQVGSEGQRRDLRIEMAPGANIQHNLEFSPAPLASPAALSGSLHVQTDTPGMAVVVDDVERGPSPLTVSDLAPGEHQVVVRGDHRTFRRSVSIEAGETLTLVLSPVAPGAAVAGWLTVSAPVVMQLRESGQLLGTTETEKLMLAAGDHDIELINEQLGFRTIRTITVAAGKVTSAVVELPPGLLSINAQPWAEVWLDGERVGETPLANLPARLGTREVVFRHPQLGERRETIQVTLHQPARLGVDLRKQEP